MKLASWASGRVRALGIEPVSERPEQFKRHIADDAAQGSELLKSAGFKPD